MLFDSCSLPFSLFIPASVRLLHPPIMLYPDFLMYSNLANSIPRRTVMRRLGVLVLKSSASIVIQRGKQAVVTISTSAIPESSLEIAWEYSTPGNISDGWSPISPDPIPNESKTNSISVIAELEGNWINFIGHARISKNRQTAVLWLA